MWEAAVVVHLGVLTQDGVRASWINTHLVGWGSSVIKHRLSSAVDQWLLDSLALLSTAASQHTTGCHHDLTTFLLSSISYLIPSLILLSRLFQWLVFLWALNATMIDFYSDVFQLNKL